MIDAFNIVQRRQAWWIVLLEGIAAFILGLYLIISPFKAIILIATAVGFYLLVMGVLALVDAFTHESPSKGWKAVSGVAGIIGGILVVMRPLYGAALIPSILILYLAILCLIHGLTQLISGIRGAGSEAVSVGVLSIALAAILFIVFPMVVSALPFLLGICGIIGGILLAVMAFRMRPLQIQTQPPYPQTPHS
ncbi:membrane protein [Dictyobacter sp. S3.2.2.5]|uniref:Membrane protein n=1 Tax=Dictyobacter halimunensis TaxID=3026934 RepID=A0ABQ6FLY3_9CHLR|nr:membrane protein [Dictyobacter sp. S3.2.2.5]